MESLGYVLMYFNRGSLPVSEFSLLMEKRMIEWHVDIVVARFESRNKTTEIRTN